MVRLSAGQQAAGSASCMSYSPEHRKSNVGLRRPMLASAAVLYIVLVCIAAREVFEEQCIPHSIAFEEHANLLSDVALVMARLLKQQPLSQQAEDDNGDLLDAQKPWPTPTNPSGLTSKLSVSGGFAIDACCHTVISNDNRWNPCQSKITMCRAGLFSQTCCGHLKHDSWCSDAACQTAQCHMMMIVKGDFVSS